MPVRMQLVLVDVIAQIPLRDLRRPRKSAKARCQRRNLHRKTSLSVCRRHGKWEHTFLLPAEWRTPSSMPLDLGASAVQPAMCRSLTLFQGQFIRVIPQVTAQVDRPSAQRRQHSSLQNAHGDVRVFSRPNLTPRELPCEYGKPRCVRCITHSLLVKLSTS